MSDAKIIEAMADGARKAGFATSWTGRMEALCRAALSAAIATGLLVRVGDAEGEWQPDPSIEVALKEFADEAINKGLYYPVHWSRRNTEFRLIKEREKRATAALTAYRAMIASTPKPGEKT